ncbi:MAG TPA: DUF4215 domain-containing protein, partial [Nannocystis exedens]|nr:DUF4215 domain-containing protein [Nannocystis exedens]
MPLSRKTPTSCRAVIRPTAHILRQPHACTHAGILTWGLPLVLLLTAQPFACACTGPNSNPQDCHSSTVADSCTDSDGTGTDTGANSDSNSDTDTNTDTNTNTNTDTDTNTNTDTGGPSCGDGMLDEGEDCDDGNTVDGDTCPADCQSKCGDGVMHGDEACDNG